MNQIDPRRGHIYRLALDDGTGMLCLLVSANIHNIQEKEYLAVLVTADRNIPPGLPSFIRLQAGDPAMGHIVCSHIDMVHADELAEDLGPICNDTLYKVNQALKRLFGL